MKRLLRVAILLNFKIDSLHAKFKCQYRLYAYFQLIHCVILMY